MRLTAGTALAGVAGRVQPFSSSPFLPFFLDFFAMRTTGAFKAPTSVVV